MTPPARSDEPSTAAPPARSQAGAARWINIVTTLVLGAAVLVIALAAAPSLVRAAIHAQESEPDFPPPERAQHPTIVPRDHPGARGFEIDDGDRGGRPRSPMAEDDSDDADLPPGVASPPRPRAPRPGAPRPSAIPHDDGDDTGLGLPSGVVMRPLRLRDRRTNTVLEEVRAGTQVSILRDDGDWVLLIKRADGELMTGWALKSELVLK